MTSTLLPNASDIDRWADRQEARSQLPRLVRRLIQATTPSIERLHFAADEGVQLGGWDGIVTARQGNSFVPDGVSVWEMGVNKDRKGKADEDYDKRTQDPLGLDPKETTFVFVTPRRWSNKGDWATSRRDEGKWADVRAYDADDIETWLEQAPAVHLWLSMLVGKRPPGARALEDWWQDWTAKTDPAFSPNLVIGGRQEARERLEAWLRGQAALMALGSESPDEALAFLSAVIAAQGELEREGWFSRAIVVEDAASWHAQVLASTRSILVPRFEGEIEGVSRAVNGGHHVFLAGEHGGTRIKDALPRIVRDRAEEALEDMGLPHDRTVALATLARRSLPALRRKLASEPTLRKPAWAQPEVARQLLAPLLAGTWQDLNMADRKYLARLAGALYERLQEDLVRWIKAAEPPLRLVGGLWVMAAPEDAWRLLAPFLTGDDIARFKQVALDVLCEPSAQTSSIVERLGADVNREEPRASATLRDGIASTLALMAALSSEVPFVSGSSGEEEARGVVWSLFERAKEDAELWALLAPVLPLLGEAAPTQFLEAVDAGLKGDNPLLRAMFHDEEANHGVGPISPHNYLLWALETLSWNSNFFGRAVLALARLARIDPGGKNGNRPAGSLHKAFSAWYPNTTISVERRLKVLDAVRKHEPKVAWPLLLGVLPSMYDDVCSALHGPTWHDWKPDEQRAVPDAEVDQMVEAVVERLLLDAGADAARWRDLISRAEDLRPHLREKLLDALDALDSAVLAPEERMALADALRSQVLRHREFPEADWTMPEEHLARLEAVGQKLEPDDLVLRHCWRFGWDVPLEERPEMSLDETFDAVAQLRSEALQEIVASQGWEGVLRLASRAEDPESVGVTLGALAEPPVDVDAFLAENLAALEPWRAAMALGWVGPRARRNDQTWVQARLAAAQGVWRPEQWGEFFLPFPLTPSLLDQLEGLEEDAQRHYWSRTRNVALLDSPQEAERIIERLLWAGRAAPTLQAIRRALHKSPDVVAPDRIMDVLEAAMTGASADGSSATPHDFTRLFDHLAKTQAPRERLAHLEWLCFVLHPHTRSPKVLHAELARDPEFFVELLSLIDPTRLNKTQAQKQEEESSPTLEPENFEDSQETQAKVIFAQRAWFLLHRWNQMPGLSEDKTLDEEHLRNWVERARELAKEKDCSEIALVHIGQALAHSPRDEDGAWPHRAVRDIIEDIANPDLESGFHCQAFNNRGFTMRGSTDGGAQERIMAERYEKDAAQTADLWPRTASMLRDLVQDYQRHARREDHAADLTQDFWK